MIISQKAANVNIYLYICGPVKKPQEDPTLKIKPLPRLLVTLAGVFLALAAIRFLNQSLLPAVPLAARAVLLIAVQWLLLVVPVLMMRLDGTTLLDIGFQKEFPLRQVLVGMVISLAMSLVFTVVPILCGLGQMVGSTQYTRPWQFAYDFAYKTLGVALAEEVVFRGYVFKLLGDIKHSKAFAILVSSCLFGLLHLPSGGVVQAVVTALIGALLCVLREKIKNCSLLSLIIAHGFYDGLITLWVGVL